MAKRKVGDIDFDTLETNVPAVGYYTGFVPVPKSDQYLVRPREFPIGFHVAAPGPSHDDLIKPKPRKRRRRSY